MDALIPARSLPTDRHPAAVYLARLSPGSRRTMRQALDAMAGLLSAGELDAAALDWSAVRYQHAAAVRTLLATRYQPSTANKMLSALRGVLKEAWRLGLMPAEDYQRAADVGSVRGESLPRGRALEGGELSSLLAACAADPTAAGARDGAMLALLYGAGLRRSELVGLDLVDYDIKTGGLVVRGKGSKERIVYVANGAEYWLTDWRLARGPEPGPLFLSVHKSGRVGRNRLTGQAVLYLVARRAREAGVPQISPHDLRRTFVSHLLDAGADIVTVQKLAGHANVQTTARYDRRGEAVKRRTTELLHIPYSKPTKSGRA